MSPLTEPKFRTLLRRFASSAAIQQASWVTGLFMVLLVLRVGGNIVLTHLLAPAVFGVMALINSLRNGVELLTDLGVNQSIVVNDRGDQPAFYSTAWTINILRGLALTAIGLLAAWPIAHLYGRPELFPLLAACSTIFLLTGVCTPAQYLMQRRRRARNLALLDGLYQVIGLMASIGFAIVMPTVWGMIWAMVLHTALCAVITYTIIDLKTLSFRLEREHLAAILHFGKWVFVSSLVYFFASNFDRLYLPLKIPLALFGVYGIAKSMSDLATQLMQKLGAMVVFPAVAQEKASLQERMPRVVKLRSIGLALVSVALGGGIAISDLFVTLAYDDRYAVAAVLLPIMLMGAWFSVQAAVSEAVLLGLAQPSRTAAANVLKLVLTVSLITLAFARGNLLIGFLVLGLSDIPRYFVLLAAQHRARLRFGRYDLALFLLMLGSALVFRAPLVGLGLVDGFVSSGQWTDIQILLALVAS